MHGNQSQGIVAANFIFSHDELLLPLSLSTSLVSVSSSSSSSRSFLSLSLSLLTSLSSLSLTAYQVGAQKVSEEPMY